jgi:hypothetical protein
MSARAIHTYATIFDYKRNRHEQQQQQQQQQENKIWRLSRWFDFAGS